MLKVFGYCFDCWNTGQCDAPDGPWWYYCDCEKGKALHVKHKLQEAAKQPVTFKVRYVTQDKFRYVIHDEVGSDDRP